MDITKRVQKYVNVSSIEEARKLGYERVEVKSDGWWLRVVVRDGQAQFFTRQNELKHEKPAGEIENGVFIGEYIYGTAAAQSHPDLGKVRLFDWIEDAGGNSLTDGVWRFRKDGLQLRDYGVKAPDWWTVTPDWPISEAEAVWERFVIGRGEEGLVFKKVGDPYGCTVARLKRMFTMDYVVMGVTESTLRPGMLKSLICGLYVGGKLVRKVTVGGGWMDHERRDFLAKPETVIGKVLEVTSWQIFPKGSCRHPNPTRNADGSIRWRCEEKTPEECVWES